MFNTVMAAAVTGILIFCSAVDGNAQGMKGKRGMMGGGMEQKPAPQGAEGSDGPAPDVLGAFSPTRATREHMEARGFSATGLQPVYPADANCPVVTSPFASPYRGDGSTRSRMFFQGLHGGIDIPVPEGTPIIAVADGTLVRKEVGESIGGIGMVVQHAPQDTGLPVWIYTEYKHLQELPPQELGAKVRMGEVIAKAGITGTVGKQYGAAGHSHLHLTAWYSDNSEYRSQRMFIPVGGQWMDPLALFRKPPLDTPALRNLPDDQKATPIPYKTAAGRIVPENTRMVWPFVCAQK